MSGKQRTTCPMCFKNFEVDLYNLDTDSQRLERVESMLIYLLETTAAEQVVKPNLEQAKALQAMGQPPWPTIKRDTNKFEIWNASWQALQARRQAATAGQPPEE